MDTAVSQNELEKASGKVSEQTVQAFLPCVIIFYECIALPGKIV